MSGNQRRRKPAAGLGPRNCIICGAEFQPYRSNHLVCSRKCQYRTPKAIATLRAYQARPDVRERIRLRESVTTSPDSERRRRYNLRNALSKYGVTIEQYESMLAAQEGKCILCGHVPPPDGIKAASRLHVDHDHTTGALRDLLCGRCNQGVGFFRDDPDLLRAAADYIERHRTE